MKSPSAFACDPLRLQVEPQEYSTNSQTMIGDPLSILTYTAGGTRTYDVSGRPWDNDAD